MFTDIVDSVAMKRRLGDAAYYGLLARHNELFGQAAAGVKGTEIIKATGDGYLVRFKSASSAAQVAIAFQSLLAEEPWAPEAVLVRTGIHVGEAMEVPGFRDEPDVIGLAVDMAARIMSLARPGQVLLTRTAFDDARQYVRAKEGTVELVASVRWLAHGQYLVKGSDEPVDVYEVGTVGQAPLSAPPDSEKARRSIRVEEEELLGWRPAPLLKVPGRNHWSIERKLGEGGFGEVWLAAHAKTGEQRVLKFCFDAERLRFLRRELTLFRILRESLGDRADIVKIHDVHLESPPYFLESAYSEQGNLLEWAKANAPLSSVPLQARIDILARVADAVGAAHGVGILHKDIKPANILMFKGEDGNDRPRLADFGISVLTENHAAKGRNITLAGFTVVSGTTGSSSTGTPMYMPPEVLAGQPFTTQGDVYALGVMLYQLVVGDLMRPIGQGWENDISEPVLREDIRRCVTADLRDRFSSAASLAKQLRTIQTRRTARHRRRVIRTTSFTLATALILGAVSMWAVSNSRALRAGEEAKVAKVLAENEASKARRAEESARAEQAKGAAVNLLLDAMLISVDPKGGRTRVTKPTVLLDAAREVVDTGKLDGFRDVKAETCIRLAKTYLGLSEFGPARKLAEMALKIREDDKAARSAVAEARHWVAYALRSDSEFERSAEQFEIALVDRRAIAIETEVAETLYEYGSCLRSLKRFEESEKAIRESIDIRNKYPRERTVQLENARAANSLARLMQDLARFDEAETLAIESLKAREKWLGPENASHRDIIRSRLTIGQLKHARGDLAEARRVFEQAVAAFGEALGTDNSEVAGAQIELARVLLDLGDVAAAASVAQAALKCRRNDVAGGQGASTPLADALIAAGLVASRQGNAVGATAMLREASEIMNSKLKKIPNHHQILQANLALGEAYLTAGDLVSAKPLLVESARAWLKENRSPTRTFEAIELAQLWCRSKLTAEPDDTAKELLKEFEDAARERKRPPELRPVLTGR